MPVHSENISRESVEQAIWSKSVHVFYQPIWNTTKKEVSSYEALMRLMLSDGRMLTPDQFLNEAREIGRYEALEKSFIQQMCKTFDGTSHKFSFNFFVQDILNPDLRNFAIKNLIQHQLINQVCIEVLEWDKTNDYDEFSRELSSLRALGIKIALDDFFKDYSTLRRLIRLRNLAGNNAPVDIIKVDRSHIDGIALNAYLQGKISKLRQRINDTDIQLVAEGVETHADHQKLHDLGMNNIQGFLIGRPQPGLYSPTGVLALQ